MQSKCFLCLLLLICCKISNAQFKKGSRMIGAAISSGAFSAGTTSFTYPASTGYTANNTNFNISLTPSCGFFIRNNTAIGFSLLMISSYQKVSNKTIMDTVFSSNKVTSTDFGIGAFLRYYFTIEKSFKPFVQVSSSGGSGFGNTNGFAYGTDNFGMYRDDYEGKTSDRLFFNAGINLGFTKKVGQNIGLDAFAGYLFSYTTYQTETSSVRDYVSISGPDDLKKFQPTLKFTGNGVNLGVGLQFFFDRK